MAPSQGVQVGDSVQVVDREPTPADQKSGLFYNHFRGLSGTIERSYDDGSVCVVVNHSSLSREALARLKRAEKLIKPRWKTTDAPAEAPAEAPPVEAADGAEGEEAEAIEEIPEEEGDSRPGLRYAIVLRPADLQRIAKTAARPAATERRATFDDLAAKEEEHLKRIAASGR